MLNKQVRMNEIKAARSWSRMYQRLFGRQACVTLKFLFNVSSPALMLFVTHTNTLVSICGPHHRRPATRAISARAHAANESRMVFAHDLIIFRVARVCVCERVATFAVY